MPVSHIRAGDRLPPLEIECFDGGGPVSLAGASDPKFYMESLQGTTVVNGSAASITSTSAPGRLKYEWGASDTVTPGVYRAWFTVTKNSRNWSFPNSGRNGGLSVIIDEAT